MGGRGLADCREAEKSIVLEQLIFVTDDFGERLIDACAERAAAGVKVRFLWDAWGSFHSSARASSRICGKRASGFVFWKTVSTRLYRLPNFRAWFFRNHRRTLVIDDKTGYTGSMCVKDGWKSWRDTNLRIKGPVVARCRTPSTGCGRAPSTRSPCLRE